jgi:hypothetical protein
MTVFQGTKIAFATLCVLLMILMAAIETNFFATPRIKRWGPLVGEDFQGIPPPFTSFGAGIHTWIYLEYDSSRNNFRSYSGQNNQRSWAKRSLPEESFITHEQYHFNITEVHSRKLNAYILANPGKPRNHYENKMLGEILPQMQRMQDDYDDQTDHSLYVDQQNYWQYTIDSLLLSYADSVTHFTDSLYTFCYPRTLTPEPSVTNDGIYFECYEAYDYGIRLAFTKYWLRSKNMNHEELIRAYHNRYDSIMLDSISCPASVICNSWGHHKGNHYLEESVWALNDNHLYQLTITYVVSGRNAYRKLARSILNSFRRRSS